MICGAEALFETMNTVSITDILYNIQHRLHLNIILENTILLHLAFELLIVVAFGNWCNW